MEVKQPQKTHRFDMNARSTALITGVKEVRSFDEQEVVLEMEQEILVIRGQGLHVGRLNIEKGEVDLTGRVDSLIYSELKGFKKSSESLMKRLFR